MNKLNITYFEKIIHDMNAQVHNICLFSELLLQGTDKSSTKNNKEISQYLNDSGIKLSKIVGLLSSITNIKSDKINIKKEESDLIELLNKEIKYHKTQNKINLDLKINFNSKIPSCLAEVDQFWFSQLVANVINNAINHCNQGLIEVSADIFSKNSIDYFRLNVIDEGCGIPEDELETIFLPLTRGSRSILRNINGAGIGLAIAREVAKAHNGSIYAKNNPKVGANFEVLIPLKS